MNKHTEIEEFARVLIEWVRDGTIRSCDRHLQGDATDPITKRWREAMCSARPEELLKVVIPDIVDATLAYLFGGIDQEVLPLSFTASDNTSVDLSRDGFGELSGWFMGQWRAQYSKERFVDDCADLENFFHTDHDDAPRNV